MNAVGKMQYLLYLLGYKQGSAPDFGVTDKWDNETYIAYSEWSAATKSEREGGFALSYLGGKGQLKPAEITEIQQAFTAWYATRYGRPLVTTRITEEPPGTQPEPPGTQPRDWDIPPLPPKPKEAGFGKWVAIGAIVLAVGFVGYRLLKKGKK